MHWSVSLMSHTFRNRQSFIYAVALFFTTALPGCVYAASLASPIAYPTISSFVQAILKAVVLIIFPLVVLMLVYTGFLFVKAQGKEQEITKARQAFFWTVIGGLLVLGAQALSLAIEATVDEIQSGTISAAPVRDIHII